MTPRIDVYIVEVVGTYNAHGEPREFEQVELYYFDKKKRAVFTEWIVNHKGKTYCMLNRVSNIRSMVAMERKWHTDAANMGKFIISIDTHMTKLGEL
jgi:hypothetical protein